MAAISISTIQDNVADAITAIVGGGFKRSTFPILMFGKTQQTVAHLGFAVGANSTGAVGGRQNPPEGVECTTQIECRFAYRVRPLSQNADYSNPRASRNCASLRFIRSDNSAENSSFQSISDNKRTLSAAGFCHRIASLTGASTAR